ncbi:unnamed protein product [Amoebophrya sp. A120]|nr:unnamed protein product [Amoebophrya sp. A120]|eukprot:GSA120T00021061001.1
MYIIFFFYFRFFQFFNQAIGAALSLISCTGDSSDSGVESICISSQYLSTSLDSLIISRHPGWQYVCIIRYMHLDFQGNFYDFFCFSFRFGFCFSRTKLLFLHLLLVPQKPGELHEDTRRTHLLEGARCIYL